MRASYLISIVVCALLLYPLSFGPVVWIRNQINLPLGALDSLGIEFYDPLVRLAARNRTTCDLLIRYQFLVGPTKDWVF
jgi:hypothetical protein